jgi:predicted secreted acid phosphatase
MRTRLIAVALLFCCWSAEAQNVVTLRDEPRNLNEVKKDLKAYQACTNGCYLKQLDEQADVAIRLLRQSVAAAEPGDKLAIVLDIDETSLSNWAVEIRDDFGNVGADLNMCIALRCGKAIAGTLRIVREAEEKKVAVFFITGRRESQKDDTEANLKTEGYSHWEGLSFRPDSDQGKSVIPYKSGERAKIVAEGYRIVLNVGDQMSDLEGYPMADNSVKMPNPFYFLP